MLPEHLHKQLSVLVQRSLFIDIFKPSPDYVDVPGKDKQGSEVADALFWVFFPNSGAISGGLLSSTYLVSSSFSMARWSNMFLSFSWAISSTRALGEKHRWPKAATKLILPLSHRFRNKNETIASLKEEIFSQLGTTLGIDTQGHTTLFPENKKLDKLKISLPLL